MNVFVRSAWRPAPWLGAAIVIMLAAGVLPIGLLVLTAVRDLPSVGAIVSPRTLILLVNTVRLGLLVAIGTGILGTALGILLEKTDVPGRRVLMAIVTFPLFLPPYVLALGWFAVLGRQGLVSSAFGPRAGLATSDAFFDLGGAVLVLTVAYVPIVLHLVRIALGAIDPAAEEAARLRFGWRRTVTRIDLPLIGPAAALGIVVAFMLAVGEFGVPAYLRYRVFSGEVLTQFAAFLDIRAAVVTAIPLTLVALGALAVERYWLRDRIEFLGRVRLNSAVVPLGAWRLPAAAAAGMYVLISVGLPWPPLVIGAAVWATTCPRFVAPATASRPVYGRLRWPPRR